MQLSITRHKKRIELFTNKTIALIYFHQDQNRKLYNFQEEQSTLIFFKYISSWKIDFKLTNDSVLLSGRSNYESTFYYFYCVLRILIKVSNKKASDVNCCKSPTFIQR